MPGTPQHPWVSSLALALFLGGQILSVAHAGACGPGTHVHDGVVCPAIATDEQDGLVPPADLTGSPVIAVVSAAAQPATDAPLKRLYAIGPPPTGPPSI